MFDRDVLILSIVDRWGFDIVSGYKHKPIPPNSNMSLEELRKGGYVMDEHAWLNVSLTLTPYLWPYLFLSSIPNCWLLCKWRFYSECFSSKVSLACLEWSRLLYVTCVVCVLWSVRLPSTTILTCPPRDILTTNPTSFSVNSEGTRAGSIRFSRKPRMSVCI